MQRALCFDDVLLVPQYSEISTRSCVNLSPPGFDEPNVRLTCNHSILTCPVVGSPMDTVMGARSAAAIAKLGGFGVLHRYCSIDESKEMFLETLAYLCAEDPATSQNVMVAIPATGDYMERATELYNAGCRAFCIDVAHGHHVAVKTALGQLRNKFGKNIHVMTGNVATLEAFNDLADWGSDSVRVGVGGGSLCTTRIVTGHGIPTLQSILDCAKSDRDVFIVADGGIRNSGDAVKALAAGADMVMLGSVLSGHDESPGALVDENGKLVKRQKPGQKLFKQFRGMASSEAQISWRGKVSVVEGVATYVPYKGPIQNTLMTFLDGIRSGLSYSGTKTIREFRSKSKFVTVTSQTVRENVPHGKISA